ncbi:MAG: ribose 5-phosphate isomerase B [Chloroflexi bacterium]|nr:ribose 5-phosphate isomerase B [Chloroflexota bacterium]
MRIVVGADHRGYELKDQIAAALKQAGHEVLDVGTHNADSVDYPDYARAIGRALTDGRAERAVLVCGSGVGASIAANKIRGVRAAICHDTYSARQGVEHDDMNVLCLGAGVIDSKLALELVQAYLDARLSGEERYRRRLEKVAEMERQGR